MVGLDLRRGRESHDLPLRNLVLRMLGLDEPNIEDVKPLREELGFEKLREHSRPEDRPPRKDVFERSKNLVPGIDLKVVPESGAELGQDVLEDERVPLICREDLQGQESASA